MYRCNICLYVKLLNKTNIVLLGGFSVVQGSEVGVRVNSVAPGHVETPIYGDMPKESLVAVSQMTQLIGRPATSDEVRSREVKRATEHSAARNSELFAVFLCRHCLAGAGTNYSKNNDVRKTGFVR